MTNAPNNYQKIYTHLKNLDSLGISRLMMQGSWMNLFNIARIYTSGQYGEHRYRAQRCRLLGWNSDLQILNNDIVQSLPPGDQQEIPLFVAYAHKYLQEIASANISNHEKNAMLSDMQANISDAVHRTIKVQNQTLHDAALSASTSETTEPLIDTLRHQFIESLDSDARLKAFEILIDGGGMISSEDIKMVRYLQQEKPFPSTALLARAGEKITKQDFQTAEHFICEQHNIPHVERENISLSTDTPAEALQDFFSLYFSLLPQFPSLAPQLQDILVFLGENAAEFLQGDTHYVMAEILANSLSNERNVAVINNVHKIGKGHHNQASVPSADEVRKYHEFLGKQQEANDHTALLEIQHDFLKAYLDLQKEIAFFLVIGESRSPDINITSLQTLGNRLNPFRNNESLLYRELRFQHAEMMLFARFIAGEEDTYDADFAALNAAAEVLPKEYTEEVSRLKGKCTPIGIKKIKIERNKAEGFSRELQIRNDIVRDNKGFMYRSHFPIAVTAAIKGGGSHALALISTNERSALDVKNTSPESIEVAKVSPGTYAFFFRNTTRDQAEAQHLSRLQETVSIDLFPGAEGEMGGREILGSMEDALKRKQKGEERLEVKGKQNTILNLSELIEKEEALISDMETALKRGNNDGNPSFVLMKQPICDSHDPQKKNGEILLRFRNSNGDMVYPDTFFPLAGRKGLSVAIDHWVATHTIQWIRDHPDDLGESYFSLNIEPQTFRDPTLLPEDWETLEDDAIVENIRNNIVPTNCDNALSRVYHAISRDEISAQNVRLEIIEREVDPRLIRCFRRVFDDLAEETPAKRVSFVLDDFGALDAGIDKARDLLRDKLIDGIKIDRDFSQDAESLRAMLSFVGSLDPQGKVSITIEGIENTIYDDGGNPISGYEMVEKVVNQFKESENCDRRIVYGQGFADELGKPSPLDQNDSA